MSVICTSQKGDILSIILNRPKKLNAFSEELVDRLIDTLDRVPELGVRLVTFSGNGKGFSGGFDLSDIKTSTDGDLVLRFLKIEKLLQVIHHSSFATMAFVQGPCYGAAADLVASCHWRVASPNSRFLFPGSRFGLVLGTRRLNKLIGEDRARQLILRDLPFDAHEALAAGFLTHVSEPEEWKRIENNIFKRVCSVNPTTFSRLSACQRDDNRNSDMAELVKSATDKSIKSRIMSYLNEMVEKKR